MLSLSLDLTSLTPRAAYVCLVYAVSFWTWLVLFGIDAWPDSWRHGSFELTNALTKVSLCLFYRRIMKRTSSKALQWTNTGALVFIVSYAAVQMLVQVFVCTPIHAFWLQYSFIPPYTESFRCINEGIFQTFVGVITVVTDFFITLLPLFTFRRLQVSRPQKLALAANFSLGFLYVPALFYCVAELL